MTQPPPAESGPPTLELEGLEVRFRARPILRGLDAVLRGRSIGLLGPNGAGKTTLLNTLLGFHLPSAGTARVLGLDIRTDVPGIRARLGSMPENEALIPGMSAVRMVRMMGELSGMPPAAALERAHEALFTVGLGEARYRPVETFSLGMKQLVKLAQAIVHAPQILFLDEPTNGLEPRARERMLRLVRQVRDAGRIRIVLSSHLLRDVEECCDEVLVLKDGAVAAVCNLEEERRAHRRFLEIETDGEGAVAFLRGAEALGCECAQPAPGRIKMVMPEGIAIRDLYRIASEAGVRLRRLRAKRDSLQDIFLKAMGNGRGGR